MLLAKFVGLVATATALYSAAPTLQRITRLPSITVCLLAGILLQYVFSGPLLKLLVPAQNAALGVITIAAGSELIVANLRSNASAISAIMCSMLAASLLIIVPLEVPLLGAFPSALGMRPERGVLTDGPVPGQAEPPGSDRRAGRALQAREAEAGARLYGDARPRAVAPAAEGAATGESDARAANAAQLSRAAAAGGRRGPDTTRVHRPANRWHATPPPPPPPPPPSPPPPPPLPPQPPPVSHAGHAQDSELSSPQLRLVVSLFSGTLAIARSPASAIAVIKDLQADGTFTQTVLGVTMVSDVVVILLFSATTELAHMLLEPGPEPATDGSAGAVGRILVAFVPRVAAELGASCLHGISLAGLCLLALQLPRSLPRLRQLSLFGIAAYAFHAERLISWALSHLGTEGPRLEPMLSCIVTGFLVCNGGDVFTGRDERMQLGALLHAAMGPTLTFFFFTTGLSMRLSVLLHTWPLALALFTARLLAIFVGHAIGARIGGLPRRYRAYGSLAYVTQAGMSLGLASEIARAFPRWGPALQSNLMSVILLNQLAGPPLLEFALRAAGEEGGVHDGGAAQKAATAGTPIILRGVSTADESDEEDETGEAPQDHSSPVLPRRFAPQDHSP